MNKKKLGLGSLALPLSLIAIIWGSNIHWLDEFCLGDTVLNFLGIPSWSNGTTGIHFTVFYGLIFLIPAFILGLKKHEDLFAAVGKWISVAMITVFLVVPFLMAL